MPSARLIKRSSAAHSWLGLMVGLFMYLVCLTGTLLVCFPDFIRWEQPQMLEGYSYDPAALGRALDAAMRNKPPTADHLYLSLNDQMPRTMIFVSDLRDGWVVNPDGTPGEAVHPYWTQLLMRLHIYLMLPMSWGETVVSSLGALLCALVMSGFLAHPIIVKDAFAFRLQRTPRIKYFDIHNRLAVWGAPFHLMIALTGASFGLALPVLTLQSYAGGVAGKTMLAAAYGTDPELQQHDGHFDVARVLREMRRIAPQARPMFIEVYRAGTPGQFMDLSAQIPGRLIFSDDYRFDMAGNYLGRTDYSDGPGALQALESAYRLHAGMFGGVWVRMLYFILGMTLTVVSATGVTLWLERRRYRDFLNRLWPALVWGVPAALAASAITDVLFELSGVWPFLTALGASVVLALFWCNEVDIRGRLQLLTGVLIVLLLAGYLCRFGSSAWSPAAMGMNLALLGYALGCVALSLGGRAGLATQSAVE